MRSRTLRRSRPRRARASAEGCGPHVRATAVAPRLRRFPAPGRRGTPAGLNGRARPGATRGGSRPLRTRDRRGCRAGARRAIGSAIAGGSRLDGDEPAALVERPPVAELSRQLLGREEALVHLPARSVLEHALLPLNWLVPL